MHIPNFLTDLCLKREKIQCGTYCIAYLSDISKFFKVTTDRTQQDFPHKLHLRLGDREKRGRVGCGERRVTIVINMHGVETSKAFHISRTDVVACFIHLGQCQVLPNQPKKKINWNRKQTQNSSKCEEAKKGREREGEKRGREELRVHEWNMRSSGIVSISVSVSISAERRERRRWEKQKQKKKKQSTQDETVDCAAGVAAGVNVNENDTIRQANRNSPLAIRSPTLICMQREGERGEESRDWIGMKLK